MKKGKQRVKKSQQLQTFTCIAATFISTKNTRKRSNTVNGGAKMCMKALYDEKKKKRQTIGVSEMED